MATSLYPHARREGFIIQPLDGELILHDGEVTHLLNVTAASVWQLCDGHHSLAEISQELALPEETIVYTLQQLARKQLLQKNADAVLFSKPLTRREFLKKGALVAAAIPVVKTIQLPSPQDIPSNGGVCTCPDCTGVPTTCDGMTPCQVGTCIDGCCQVI